MDFRLLGPLEVVENGAAIDVGSAKPRALLAVLLLNANRVVSRDDLVDALWGERAPGTAQKALQVYVSQLRKSLGRERILTRAVGYQLCVEPGELDLEQFTQLVENQKFGEALRLWRGSPLADFAYEPFAQSEIARLDELRQACLERRIEADLAAGRHADLVGELEALVGEHPLRERLREQLMLALYRSGRQAQALEVYATGRRLLSEELGLEPSPQLRELEKAILRQDADLVVWSADERLEEVPEASRSALVGREVELSALREAFAGVVAARGRLMLLAGEPGIGKSRLTEELVAHARTLRASVLIGRCWEGGGAPAYWPWVQSLREHVRTTEDATLRAQLGAGAVDVTHLIPEVRERFVDVPQAPDLDSESARFRLFDSTATFLRRAAVDRPLLVVLDDLHAADEPSLLLLRFVAGTIADSRILVVGTYRDVDPTVRDPLAAALAELTREPVTQRLHLKGLTKPDVAHFIEQLAGATPTPDLVAAVHEETEGNPLFVGEVVRLLVSEGRLTNLDRSGLSALGIPQSVRDVIERRLRRLSRDCIHLLTVASVLGREFALDAIEEVSELSSEQLYEVLDEALNARALSSVPGERGRLRFAHALIRETLYENLTTLRRVQLHRRIAEMLEALYAADPTPHLAELAYHFAEAAPGGDVDKALDYAQRAATRAGEQLAFEEAARLYELALEILELKQGVDRALRCELLLDLGEVLARAGDESAASAAFLGAADIARSNELAEQLARAALGYAGRFVWMVRGADEDVVPLLEDALRELGDAHSVEVVRLLGRLAGALRDQPEAERRIDLSARAVAMARRLGDPATLAYALDSRYCAVWGPDNLDERLQIAAEMLGVADNAGDTERLIQGRYYRAVTLLELGQTSEVHAELEVMHRIASELRQPAQRWYVEGLRGMLALLEGDLELAGTSLDTGTGLGSTMRASLIRASSQVQNALLQRERGEFEESIAMLRRTVEEMPTITVFQCLLGNLCALSGDDGEARTILDSLARSRFDILPDNDKLPGWCLLAELCLEVRHATHASTVYQLLAPYGHLNAVCHPTYSLGAVSRYLGLLATVLEEFDAAIVHFQDALEANSRMAAQPWLAHTQEDYARLLLKSGVREDREKSAALLEAACATFRKLGMTGPLARAEAVIYP